MQVIFKLNQAQLVRATVIANTFGEPSEWTLASGSEMLHEPHEHCCLNTDQALVLNRYAGTMTYTGQRHPFIQDGAYDVVCAILGGEAAANVIYYETSDKRLRWNETLDGYCYRAGSLEECLKHIPHDLPARYQWVVRGADLVKVNPAKASAQFTKAEMAAIKRFAAAAIAA